jgi:hypothetical protein
MLVNPLVPAALAAHGRAFLMASTLPPDRREANAGGRMMQVVQWIVAAGTAVFVALVGFFQWRTAQDKAALDLFERRHEVFLVVRKAVSQMVRIFRTISTTFLADAVVE